MPAASLPENEEVRLSVLRSLSALDTEPSPALDAITRAAALICGVPIALISLIDENRQWIKSNVGLEGMTETPRDVAFCAHAILSSDLLDVRDATMDQRFADNPLVQGAPHIRAYLGAPLILIDGTRAGALCMIDHQPREFTETQRAIMRELALCAVRLLETLRMTQTLEDTAARLRESEDLLAHTGALAGVGGWSLDLLNGELTWTAETFRIYGLPPDHEPAVETAISFFTPEAQKVLRGALDHAINTGEGYNLELRFVTATGQKLWVRAKGEATMRDGKVVRVAGALQDITLQNERRLALEATEERLRLATDGGQIGIYDWDLVNGTKHWSRWMYEIYGLAPSEEPILHEIWQRLLHPDDKERTESLLADALAGKSIYENEYRVIWADGSVRHLRSSGRATLDESGRPVRFSGANWDVTPARQMAEKLSQQHELLRVTLQSIGDGVITTDAVGRVVWMNPVAERMTGWTAEEGWGRPLPDVFRIINENTREPAPNPVEACLADGQLMGLANHTILISRTGDEFGIEDSASPICTDTGELVGVVMVFHDVTAQRQISGEMTYRATHDSLTGLLNRAEFEVRLRHTLHTSQADRKQSVMLFIDLDEFKLVNDACGHDAGDQLLRQVAKLVGDLVRGSDAVARLGGDEFAVLLDRCTEEQALPLARKICECMEDFRFTYSDQRFRVGASIGLVPVDERWPDITGIMQAADASCYAAKEAGRNRVHHWSDNETAMSVRYGETKWATRLAQALDENSFVLFAQRILSLRTAETDVSSGIHAEVLLRMLGPDNTLCLPGAFLPAAERFHIISRIDRWVLDRAITWMHEAPDLADIDLLAVNLSGQSIGDSLFQAWVIGRLTQAGPRICHRLCLEITETAVVTNLADAARFIGQVRGTGVRVALDDFGAGASSFGYLKSLSVDFLKIDGQFVRDLMSDPLDQAAVRSFTDVAGVAGMRTVAEFVDSEAVMDRLRHMGVDYAQGFLVHKPAPIDDLLANKRRQNGDTSILLRK